jgi:hypothetical protein
MTTRQFARHVSDWIGSVGWTPGCLARIRCDAQKLTLIESTVRYLGIEIDDALAIAGQAKANIK